MGFNEISFPVRFYPVQESELGRINELCNIPEIAEHFEIIPPVSMETTRTMWDYMQSGMMSLWGIHEQNRIIGGAGFTDSYVQGAKTLISMFGGAVPMDMGKISDRLDECSAHPPTKRNRRRHYRAFLEYLSVRYGVGYID